MFQPRVGVSWDVARQRQVGRARERRHLFRAPEHAEPGRHRSRPTACSSRPSSPAPTTVRRSAAPTPTWPGVVTPTPLPAGQFPLFTGVRVFDRDYKNPRIYTFNVGYEQELAAELAGVCGLHLRAGRDLTRFLNYNRIGSGLLRSGPGHRQHVRLHGHAAVRTAARRGDGDDQPRQVATIAADARHPQAVLQQLPARGELRAGARTRTTTRTSAIPSPIAASTSSTSRRTTALGPRHPAQVQRLRLLRRCRAFQPNARVQARTAQPITREPACPERRRSRPQQRAQGQRVTSASTGGCRGRSRSAARSRSCRRSRCSTRSTTRTTSIRCRTPALFNFDGFLRTGVGDPRQVQLAVKVVW